MSKSRLEAFSDGIFAIIITIMVLDIRIPHSGHWRALLEPAFYHPVLAYSISFLLVTSFWVSHHSMLLDLKLVDRTVLWVNILALFPISLLPITTEWFGEFPNAVAPSIVYGIVYMLTVLALYLLSLVIAQRVDPMERAIMHRTNRVRLIFLAVGTLGIGLAFLIPYIIGFVIFIITVTWLIWTVKVTKYRMDD